jgi:VWFA-related protein
MWMVITDMTIKRFAPVLAAALLAALPLVAQQQPAVNEKIDVNLVLLDAVVTDRSGQQILGLDKDNFVVKEDGVPQQIDSVAYYTNRTLVTSTEENAAFKNEHIRSDRYFVVFLDKPQNGFLYDELIHARQALEKFVDQQMQPGDRMAIVGHDVRLKVYSDFSSDKTQLRKALNDAIRFSRGLTGKSGLATDSIMHNIDSSAMIDHTGNVYEGLQVLAEALRPIKARKQLILISPGILENGQSVFAGTPSESRFYKPMIQELNAADVTVSAINLDTQNPSLDPAVHDTLERVTADTNGTYYRNATNFATPLKNIEKDSSGYYLISYYTKKDPGRSGYQKVTVSLTNPEFRIKSREGYLFGPKEE